VETWLKYKSKYDWLIVSAKNLGCSTCHKVKLLGPHKSRGVKMSEEWMSANVTHYGDTLAKQQQSLRKKMLDHLNSSAHKTACMILNTQKSAIMENLATIQCKAYEASTERVFRTAYKQAKLNRPFSDMEMEIDLQRLNGIDMGRILHSDHACANIIDHIAKEMRKRMLEEIISQNAKISILIDESTSLSQKATLIIYIRCVLHHEVNTVFLDLIELNGTTSQVICQDLLVSLEKHGIGEAYLTENWIGFCCDGASVMLGRRAGVGALIVRKFPDVVIWHCAAHRLELGVGDTVEEVCGVNNFRCFMDKLYSLYHASPKNKRELHDVANSLGQQLLSIGRILSTRWVASSVRTIKAVWENYPALYYHFQQAAIDPSRDKREQATYIGLSLRLSTFTFVHNLAVMYDGLQELADLSLSLQRRDMSIPEAHKLINRELLVLESLKKGRGEHLCEISEKPAFKGITLHEGSKCDVLINANRFFQALRDNLESRLLPTHHSSNVTSAHSTNTLLYNHLKVLYPSFWPDSMDILYGADSIRALCTRFKIDTASSLQGMREFIENGGKRISQQLLPLLRTIECIPVSTAECERGFSAMNLIVTDCRSSLSISRASALMMIRLVGPPLRLWKPSAYVQSWLTSGHRHADEKNCLSRIVRDDPVSETSMYSLCKL
jgi:hypothetical protein